jgi:hypothetical protein
MTADFRKRLRFATRIYDEFPADGMWNAWRTACRIVDFANENATMSVLEQEELVDAVELARADHVRIVLTPESRDALKAALGEIADKQSESEAFMADVCSDIIGLPLTGWGDPR